MKCERTPAPNYLQSLWRLRAEETRSFAEQVLDPEAKRMVLEIAKRCDRLSALIVLVQTAMLLECTVGCEDGMAPKRRFV
jgi:acetolactate synthase small subunit